MSSRADCFKSRSERPQRNWSERFKHHQGVVVVPSLVTIEGPKPLLQTLPANQLVEPPEEMALRHRLLANRIVKAPLPVFRFVNNAPPACDRGGGRGIISPVHTERPIFRNGLLKYFQYVPAVFTFHLDISRGAC